MSSADIAEAIREKFRDDVATPNEMTVLHDNAPPPESLNQTWFRLEVMFDQRGQMSTGGIGSRRFRITGQAVLTMFRAIAHGDGELLVISDAVDSAFIGASIADPIIGFDPPPSPIGGAETSGGWFQRTVVIPFYADTFG